MKVECICSICGCKFQKPQNEYNRRIKLGKTDFYCSLNCSGKRTNNLKMIEDNRKPYLFKGGENRILTNEGKLLKSMKEFARRIRRRKKYDKEVLPEDLLQIWKTQNGKCIYTNVKLILPHMKQYSTISKNYKASIDRIDSTKCYSADNIQFVSITVNNLKSDMNERDLNEFLSIISN
jgi:hypothetical protein